MGVISDLALRGYVIAQGVTVPNPAPDANAPGLSVVTQLIGWAKMLAIGVCVLSIVVGAIVYAFGRFSTNVHAQGGATRVVSGAAGAAFLVGAASFIISVALTLAQSVGK